MKYAHIMRAKVSQRIPMMGKLDRDNLKSNAKAIASLAMPQGTEAETKAARRIRGAASYVHKMNKAALYKMRKSLDELIEAIHKRLQAESKKGYYTWVNRSLENGAGIAHKWTTQTPRPHPCHMSLSRRMALTYTTRLARQGIIGITGPVIGPSFPTKGRSSFMK